MVEERNTNQTSASGERSRSGGMDSECGTNSMMKFAGPALVSNVRFLRSFGEGLKRILRSMLLFLVLLWHTGIGSCFGSI